MRILQTRPEAVNQLICYLSQKMQIAECTEWLSVLGESDKLAVCIKIFKKPGQNKIQAKYCVNKFYYDYLKINFVSYFVFPPDP